MDQGQEDQTSETDPRRREGDARLDGIRCGSPPCDEEENLLEGSGAAEIEEALIQAGRAGAETPTRP